MRAAAAASAQRMLHARAHLALPGSVLHGTGRVLGTEDRAERAPRHLGPRDSTPGLMMLAPGCLNVPWARTEDSMAALGMVVVLLGAVAELLQHDRAL